MRFYIFMICLFCGVISGIVYDVFYIARTILCGADKEKYTLKDKIFIIVSDVLYCLIFAVGFIFVSVMFDFEKLRFYMLLGCVLGAIIYLKSFHIIVAFFAKKVYNKINIIKEKKVGRAEEKPLSRRHYRKRNNFNGNSRRGDNIPAG